MNQIREFIEFLFRKEQEAIYAGRIRERFEKYNALAAEIGTYMMQGTGFGLPVLTNPKPAIFYKENPTHPNQRHLFKISEYAHEKYGSVWACYASSPNPSNITRRISSCFLVACMEDSPKMIADFGAEPDTRKWIFYGGDEDKSLRLHNLRVPVKIERYIEPAEDQWSIEEYLKNS